MYLNDSIQFISQKIIYQKFISIMRIYKTNWSLKLILPPLHRLLGQTAVTKALLEFIGMTLTEYKKVNPDASMFENDKVSCLLV